MPARATIRSTGSARSAAAGAVSSRSATKTGRGACSTSSVRSHHCCTRRAYVDERVLERVQCSVTRHLDFEAGACLVVVHLEHDLVRAGPPEEAHLDAVALTLVELDQVGLHGRTQVVWGKHRAKT